MSDGAPAKRIREVLGSLARTLEELDRAGEGIPAVQKNAARMRGTLRALRVQFEDLEDLPA